MELTGKCKEEFEIWVHTEDANDSLELMCLREFYNLTESMQYGVLVDYFDSVGIEVNVSKDEDGLYCLTIEYNNFINSSTEWEETRLEARTTAIEKANELRNKVLNK